MSNALRRSRRETSDPINLRLSRLFHQGTPLSPISQFSRDPDKIAWDTRHEIFARVRLADVLQVKIGPQGMERLRAFRKIANQHVGFVICDRDMTILAIVDSREPDQVINPRDQKLEIIKQRCLQAAQVKYVCVYAPQLPKYRELREKILGPAADLV